MIPELVVSLLAVAGFGLALWWCRVAAAIDTAVTSSTAGLLAMLDRELDDLAKERALRRAGLVLIVSGFHLLWRFAVALAAAAAPILLADAAGLVPRDSVMALMLRWNYIVAVSVVAIVVAGLIRRRRPATDGQGASDDRYSTADRFLHAVAFASPRVLKAASRIEDRLLSESADTPSAPPIFVTSLARGGTTALLNALHDVAGIATHTYRDMPFLTAPSLWNRLAGGNLRRVDRRERAHGDGLEIDLDSPEAFEEVIWKLFWPEKYRTAAIALWHAEDRKADAKQFLARHMGKVIRARRVQARDDSGASARYCSKNNANIARLAYLQSVFPDCRIVVPFRRPASHAASLLRQHRNFLELQSEDDFIRRYMRDLGHFEFGLIHTPIAFPGFDPERYDPSTGDYWLNYWVHAFREVLQHSSTCVLVSQDDLRSAPEQTMRALCDELGLNPAPLHFATYFRSSPDESPTDGYDPRLYAEAAELHRELESLALASGIRPSPASG
jgi:hypothetical protein